MLKYYDITVCHEIEQSIGKHLYLISTVPNSPTDLNMAFNFTNCIKSIILESVLIWNN